MQTEKRFEVISHLRKYYDGDKDAIDRIYPLCKLTRDELVIQCDKCVAQIKSLTQGSFTANNARDAKQRLLGRRADKILDF